MISTQELPSLYPDAMDIDVPTDRGYHQYARRPMDGSMPGWVVQVPAQANLRKDYEHDRHFKYLDEYGQFLITQADAQTRALKHYDSRGVVWNSFVEPWRLIFQKGGAKEFPLEQVIAYHWHIRPPYREVEFPQLRGLDIVDFECPECTDKLVVFSALTKEEAARQLRIHLTSRINDSHSYSPADVQALGAELGVDFFSRRSGRLATRPSAAPIPPEVPEPSLTELPVALNTTSNTGPGVDPAVASNWTEGQTLPEVPTMVLPLERDPETVDLAFKCADCDWAPLKTNRQKPNALRMHRRHAHPE